MNLNVEISDFTSEDIIKSQETLLEVGIQFAIFKVTFLLLFFFPLELQIFKILGFPILLLKERIAHSY